MALCDRVPRLCWPTWCIFLLNFIMSACVTAGWLLPAQGDFSTVLRVERKALKETACSHKITLNCVFVLLFKYNSLNCNIAYLTIQSICFSEHSILATSLQYQARFNKLSYSERRNFNNKNITVIKATKNMFCREKRFYRGGSRVSSKRSHWFVVWWRRLRMRSTQGSFQDGTCFPNSGKNLGR